MARITVEDCLHNVDNLFQLVLLAVPARPPPGQRRRAHACRWRTTSRPWWRCARSPPATSPPRCCASRSRRAGAAGAGRREPVDASALRSSASETDGSEAIERHGLRVFAPGTAARRKAHPGAQGAAGQGRRPTCPPSRSSASARRPNSAPPRTRARSASPASPTSPTRWRPPPSSPTCTSTPTPSSRRSCTTSSRTRRRRRTSSRARFGADVAEIVDGVTKLDQIQFKSREEAQAESFRKMLLAMVRDLRVILVKLADRTHNMRTIEAMAPPRRRAIARETLDIYAPIAERLGLYTIKLELEDLGFQALYPQRYRVLERALKRARGNQKEFLQEDRAAAERGAHEEPSIAARVEAREKHLYSIYQQDAAQARAAHRDRRRLRPAHRRRHGRHLLPRARRRAQRVQADAGALQGLHRDPARQRLPVAAHHAVRPERRADRGADPHRGHASRRRVGHRRALEVQGRRRMRELGAAGARARVALEPGRAAGGRQLRGIPRERQGRPVPRQGVRVHAARARSCACRAARPWSTSPTPCTPTSATAASPPRSTGA